MMGGESGRDGERGLKEIERERLRLTECLMLYLIIYLLHIAANYCCMPTFQQGGSCPGFAKSHERIG